MDLAAQDGEICRGIRHRNDSATGHFTNMASMAAFQSDAARQNRVG